MSNTSTQKTEATVIDGAVRLNAVMPDGETRVFELSSEALTQHFGAKDASDAALLAAFEKGRTEIMAAAGKALDTPASEDAIPLGSGDFS